MPDPRNDPNSYAVAWATPPSLLTAASKLAYWKHVGGVAARLKDDELKAGLDRTGKPLAAISNYTRAHRHSEMGRADPNAPPLTPAHGLSRTRSLLTWKAYLDRVVFYWKLDAHTGDSWGVILDHHRKGGNGRLPKRDVIGLSAGARQKARREAAKWVAEHEAGRTHRETPPPKGFQRIFEPRPTPNRARQVGPKPFVPHMTEWQAFTDGKFTNVDTAGKHLEYSVKTSVGR